MFLTSLIISKVGIPYASWSIATVKLFPFLVAALPFTFREWIEGTTKSVFTLRQRTIPVVAVVILNFKEVALGLTETLYPSQPVPIFFRHISAQSPFTFCCRTKSPILAKPSFASKLIFEIGDVNGNSCSFVPSKL